DEVMGQLDAGVTQLEQEKHPLAQALATLAATLRSPNNLLVAPDTSAGVAGGLPASDEITRAKIPALLAQVMGYAGQGQLQRAEDLGEGLVKGARRISGPEGDIYLKAMALLGAVYALDRKFERAETLLKDAV